MDKTVEEAEVVKIKLADLEVACTREFATQVLERFLKNNGSGTISTTKSLVSRPPLPLQLEEGRRPHKRSVAMIAFVVMAIIAGIVDFSGYKKNQAAFADKHELAQTQKRDYRQMLTVNLDSLLEKLDALTSSSGNFRKAFPDINILITTVKAKRGSDPADKAEAAREFIVLVKQHFDEWSSRPQDFPLNMRPESGDVARFLSVWEETETLLASLKNPSS